MLTRWSDSSLPLLSKCLGPAVYKNVKHINQAANAGSAIHMHMEIRAKWGYRYAMEVLEETVEEFMLDEVQRDIAIARCKHFTWTPPPGSLPEIALAWNTLPETPEVVPVHGGQGSYKIESAFIGAPGTIDLIFAEPEPLVINEGRLICPKESILWVCDYKAGKDTWVDPISHNWQLRSAAVKAAFMTEAQKVIPAVIQIGRGEGIWDVSKVWNMSTINEMKDKLFELHDSIYSATIDNVSLVEGYHCRWCPALTTCPAKIAAVKTLINGEPITELSPEKAKELAEILPIARSIIEKSDQLLRGYVKEHGPIDLGGNRYWGPVEKNSETLMPEVWLPLLNKAFGQYAPYAISITKSGVKKAIDEYHKASKIKTSKAASMRNLLSEADKLEGIVSEPKEIWQMYRKDDNDV